MEKLFKIPMLKTMYQARAEELEKYINNSKYIDFSIDVFISLIYNISRWAIVHLSRFKRDRSGA